MTFSEQRFAQDLWTIYGCINRYSSRSLNFADDILNGIMGIFRTMERHSKIRHLWGITFELHAPISTILFSNEPPTFFDGLSWLSYETQQRRPGFPSWSWTGRFMPSGCPCVYRPKLGTPPDHPVSIPKTDPNVRVLSQSGQVLTWEDVQQASFKSSIRVRDLTNIIHISTFVTPLKVVTGGSHWGSMFEPEVSIPWDDGSWSPLAWPAAKALVTSELSGSILGVHLVEHGDYVMLIVKESGSYWERIGICFFTKKDDGAEVVRARNDITLG